MTHGTFFHRGLCSNHLISKRFVIMWLKKKKSLWELQYPFFFFNENAFPLINLDFEELVCVILIILILATYAVSNLHLRTLMYGILLWYFYNQILHLCKLLGQESSSLIFLFILLYLNISKLWLKLLFVFCFISLFFKKSSSTGHWEGTT